MTGEGENSISASARTSRSRPFYSSWADVYDLLIDDPVEPWVDVVHTEVTAQGLAAASILDAGCGTGRHAVALVALGHHLTLLDASPDLLAIAARRCPDARVRQEDLTSMRTTESYDAINCRGVLNDLITDEERQGALDAMSASLRRGGVLVLDVREREGSAARATGVPRTRTVDVSHHRTDLPPGAALTFTSTTTWHDGLMHVHEEHHLHSAVGDQHAVSDFRMRPWTRDEVQTRLRRAGVTHVEIRRGPGKRGIDRLLVLGRT